MRKLTLLAFLLTMTTIVFGQENTNTTIKTVTQSGVGLGSIIAVVTSWDRNKSIFWAIISGLLSWVYVIYFAFSRDSYDKLNKDQRQSHLFKIDYDQNKDDRNR